MRKYLLVSFSQLLPCCELCRRIDGGRLVLLLIFTINRGERETRSFMAYGNEIAPFCSSFAFFA